MIIASRIPGLTGQVRMATIRAAEHRSGMSRDRHLIDELERRGYRVTRAERPA
jgi:hypothetical protein